MSTARRPWLLLGLVLVAATALLAACGIPSDSSPQAFDESAVPDELVAPTSSTTEPDSGGPSRTVEVWFVADDQLIPALRTIDVDTGVAGAIQAALDGPTEEEGESGISSSIPAGTELLGVRQQGDRLTIDLSEELQTVGSSELRNAVAQIVYTATGYSSSITEIRFQVEGQNVPVPVEEGATANVVTRDDYDSLGPS
jgi:spore germination protein GerM